MFGKQPNTHQRTHPSTHTHTHARTHAHTHTNTHVHVHTRTHTHFSQFIKYICNRSKYNQIKNKNTVLNRKWSHSPHWNSAHKHHSLGKSFMYTLLDAVVKKQGKDVSLLEWIGTCWTDRDKGIVRLCRAVCFTSKIVIAQQCHSTERSVSCKKIQFSAKQVSLYTAVCFTSKHSKCKTGVTLQSCLFHVKNSQYKTGVTLQSGLFHDKYTVNTKQVSLYRAVCFTTNIQSMQNRCHSTVRSVSRQKHSQCKKGVTLQSCLFHVKNSQYKTGVTVNVQ